MSDKAKTHSVQFRPHFKTHQNAGVGELYRSEGIRKITVSSVDMAEYFMNLGWDDITIAFPVNIRQMDKINLIARKIKLNLVAESTGVVKYLDQNLKSKAGLFIKIDGGYNRTGIIHHDIENISEVVKASRDSSNIELKGFLIHSGHTYAAQSVKEILEIHHESLAIAGNLKNKFPGLMVSIGDTPGCSLANDFTNIDEIRPGNFVYYDMMQYFLGSCSFDKIAVSVACPVVSVHPHKKEVVVYGGAVHLSKEVLNINNSRYYGGCTLLGDNHGWGKLLETCFVKGVSQEHGIISAGEKLISTIKPGDLIGVIPVHSCLAADLLRKNTIMI